MRNVFLLIVSLAALLGSAFAVDVSACGTLSAPGTYTLIKNINTSASAHCLTVTATDVTIDCQGHSIIGRNKMYYAGIYSTKDRTAVKNCSIAGFVMGVNFQNVKGGSIEDSRINVSFGSTGGVGAWNKGGDYAVMKRTAINARGQYVPGTIGFAIEDSMIKSDNYACQSPSRLVNSTATGGWAGVTLGPMNGPYIANSVITGGQQGMYISATRNALIENNVITSGYPVQTNGVAALAVSFPNGGNVIRNNTLISSKGKADLVYLNGGTGNKTVFYWNNFTNTSGMYIRVYNPTYQNVPAYLNTSVGGHQEGNVYYNVMNGAVAIQGNVPSIGYPQLYVGNGGAGYPYNNAHSQGKLSMFLSDYAPLTPSNGSILPPVQLGSLIVNATPANGGNVTGTAYNFTVPSVRNITATPNANYTFANWSITGNCTIANASAQATTVTVNSGTCYAKAKFLPQLAKLVTAASPANGGTTAGDTYIYSLPITLPISAVPSANYIFANWSIAGNCTIANALLPNTTVTVTGSGTCTATAIFIYTPPLGSLIVNATPANGGNVTGTAYNFTVPATLPITASANANYAFVNWSISGNCTVANANAPITTVTVNGGTCYATASFIYTPPATGNLIVNATQGGSAGTSQFGFLVPATLPVWANASVNYTFANWSVSGNCSVLNASAPITTVTVNSGTCYATASFIYTPPALGNLIVNASPSNGGNVTGTAYNFTVPATKPVTAAANVNYAFSSWSISGNCTVANANAPITTVTVNSGTCYATAIFIYTPPALGSLIVNATPANGGTVTGTAYNFTVPATLPITASANANYAFVNWSISGNCTIADGSSQSTTVTVNSGTCYATANFNYTVPPQGCQCGILNVPNYVCNVTQDLASGGTCFNVTAYNVTILCNGHSLTGSASGSYPFTFGVYTSANRTTVSGCTISHFTNGVYLSGSNMSGIYGTAAYSDYFNPIELVDSGYNTIMDTSANASVATVAVNLQGSSNGNVLENVTAYSNGQAAFAIVDGIGNVINGSKASSTATAVVLSGASNNTIANSTISTNYTDAIVVITGSGNVFAGNTIYRAGNLPSGSEISFLSGALFNLAYWNNFTATAAHYITDVGAGNAYNTSINGRQEGNIYANVMNGSVAVQGNVSSSGYPAIYLGMNGSGYPYSQANSQGKVLGNAVDYAPLTPFYYNNSSAPQGCVCGNLTVPNFVCNVTSDLSAGNGNTCFNVQAYNVTILCNGHSITGKIYSSQNKTGIYGCNITGYGYLVFFNETADGVISGVSATGSSGSDAIYLQNGVNNVIANTNATSLYPGIRFDYGSNNSIINSTGKSTDFQGIILSHSNGNQIVNSRAIALGDQPAIWLTSESSNNLVKDSVASSNSGKALYISGTSSGANNNVIANNTLISNSTLLALVMAANNTFYWNNFTQTGGYYIYDNSYALPEHANHFNASINGHQEGNIYANVLNGSVNITGTAASSGFPNLYIGSNGTGYPYRASTSQGKIYDPYGEAIDYAPLTPFYYNNSSAPQGCVCGNLTTPNYVCNVTQNLASNGTCFSVLAKNVTIECNGHSITGNITDGLNIPGTVAAVFSQKNMTTVRGCAISQFKDGVLFQLSSNGLIANNNITMPPNSGNGIAIAVYSNNNVIRDSRIYSTNAAINFAFNSNNNFVTNIDARSNEFVVIKISQSNGNVVNGSMLVSNNSGDVVYFTLSSGNTIANSTLVSASSSLANFDTGAYGNMLIGNRLARYNATASPAYFVFMNSNATGNLVYWNNFTATGGYYISDYTGANYYNTTINGKPEGNIYANVMDGSVQVQGNVTSGGFPSLYIGMNGTGYPYSANTSAGKIIGDAVDYAPLTPNHYGTGPIVIQNCSCGVLSVPNVICNVAQDQSSNGTCFTVAAPDVTILCNWYAILGNGTGYGVYSNQPRTTVDRCHIGYYWAGVGFEGASNGTISNMWTAMSPQVDTIGISLSSSSYISVVNLTSNTIYGPALMLHASTHNSLSGISAASSTTSAIVLEAGSDYNTLTGNGASNYNGNGILLNQSSSNILSGARGTAQNVAGLRMISSNGNTLFNCSGLSWTASGIRLEGSNNNQVSWSNGTSSVYMADHGIDLYQSSGNSISNSIASNGMYLSSSSGNTVQSTRMVANYTLIAALGLSGSSGNAFSNNTLASNSTSAGSALLNASSISSSGNTFYWNNFTATAGYYISDSGNNSYSPVVNGRNEGNIYANVISGAAAVQGNVSSSGYPSLYIGMNGTSYPYSAGTSLGKVAGSAVDYAPLTPYYYSGGKSPLPELMLNNSTETNATAADENKTVPIDPKPIIRPKPAITPGDETMPPIAEVGPKPLPAIKPGPAITPAPAIKPKPTPAIEPQPSPAVKPKPAPSPAITPKIEPKATPSPKAGPAGKAGQAAIKPKGEAAPAQKAGQKAGGKEAPAQVKTGAAQQKAAASVPAAEGQKAASAPAKE